MNRSTRIPALGFILFCVSGAQAADGDLDGSFGVDGVAFSANAQPTARPVIAVQNDDRILLCDAAPAPATGIDFLVSRFNANGTPDATFGEDGSMSVGFDSDDVPSDDSCQGIAVQHDGRIVMVGEHAVTGSDGYSQFAVARVDATGKLDPSFGKGTGRMVFSFAPTDRYAAAYAVAFDADGRILIAGQTKVAQLDTNIAIARLLPDGSLDPAFDQDGMVTLDSNPGPLSFDVAAAIAVDSEARIVVAGMMAGSDGALVRLMPDGSLDASFGASGIALAGLDVADGRTGAFNSLIVDRSERLVAGGGVVWDGDQGTESDMVAVRFLEDGSLDAAFGTEGVAIIAFDLADNGGGTDFASGIVEQSDGKLVLAGSVEYGGLTYTLAAAARIDESGTLDESFAQGGKSTFDIDLPASDTQWLSGVALQGNRPVAVGGMGAQSGNPPSGDILIRLQNDRIFNDRFE
jgi:uncharacterized delta-60 repeat protein